MSGRSGEGGEVLSLEEAIRDAILPVDVEQRDEGSFRHFRCLRHPLPTGLLVYDITIDPVVISRKSLHIADNENEDFFLTSLVRGRVVIDQQSQRYELMPGDLALMAGGLPYTVDYREPSRRIVVRIPHPIFRERLVSAHHDLVIGKLPAEGIGLVVSDLMKVVATEARGLPITDQYTLGQSLLELTASLTRAALKQRELKEDVRHPGLLNRIFAYLEEHYMDPGLNPKLIAQANGISIRYLHALFRESGTTVLRWVWERRLRAARNDLLDPTQRHLRISEIAFRQGFNDTAHFSRAFRNRFGISPSELRRRATSGVRRPGGGSGG
ncbi:MAG: helix-turn-helix domain-containing protein [Gammaproteobacteria bacterium]|nr:MAG: helix-turn-helix domain-containing protein [Gammaproteobacteria bacterium]